MKRHFVRVRLGLGTVALSAVGLALSLTGSSSAATTGVYSDQVVRASANPGTFVTLNPQPLPPKTPILSNNTTKFGDAVSLNPQPLPPKVKHFRRFQVKK